jgi:hypothetical protein
MITSVEYKHKFQQVLVLDIVAVLALGGYNFLYTSFNRLCRVGMGMEGRCPLKSDTKLLSHLI